MWIKFYYFFEVIVMDLEDLFYDNIPDDGEFHHVSLNVAIVDDMIRIDAATHGIIVDGKRVD
jgi:hypothetical protein